LSIVKAVISIKFVGIGNQENTIFFHCIQAIQVPPASLHSSFLWSLLAWVKTILIESAIHRCWNALIPRSSTSWAELFQARHTVDHF